MSEKNNTSYGMVAYSDGSFRRGVAGWGIHAYTYTLDKMTSTMGEKQLPTKEGYKVVDLKETVTIVNTVDAYCAIRDPRSTNNIAELEGVTNSFKIAKDLDVQRLTIYTDSEYVQKNIFNSVPKWVKNNWVKPNGEVVKNRNYWESLISLKDEWLAAGKNVDIRWVRGHNGDKGNEAADRNALLATANPNLRNVPVEPTILIQSNDVAPTPEGTKPNNTKVKVPTSNPLLLKTRLLFDAHKSSSTKCGDHTYYCMYSLGRGHGYGHKQQDTILEKLVKTDLILGRRSSEACFSILRTETPDPYLEELINNHKEDHLTNTSQPAIIHLNNAMSQRIRKQYMEIGKSGFAVLKEYGMTVDAEDTLISKSLTPPRQAYSAIMLFNTLKSELDNYCNDTLGQHVIKYDITDSIFETVTVGNKKPVTKIKATITNNTPTIEAKAVIGGTEVKLKLVLGLDIPVRNTLAKAAELSPKVFLIVVANGPLCYSFSSIIDTTEGTLLTCCPYTQFVIKK